MNKTIVGIFVLFSTFIFNPQFFSHSFWNRWVVKNDSLQQTYVFHQSSDPELFKGDPLSEYMRFYMPPLYRWGMDVLCRFFDPLNLGKILHILTLLLAALAAATLGYRFAGLMGAFAAGLMVLTDPLIQDRCAGGLPRAFGFPLGFLIISGIFWQRWRLVLGSLLLSIGLFPPTALAFTPSLFGILIINKGLKIFLLNKTRRWNLIFFIFIFIGLGLTTVYRPPWIGQPYSLKEAKQTAAWSKPVGRFKELPWKSPFKEAVGEITHSLSGFSPTEQVGGQGKVHFFYSTAWFLLAAFLISVFRKKIRWKPLLLIGSLIFSAIAMFLVARAFAFNLFIPRRIFTYGLVPLVLMGLIIMTVAALRPLTKNKNIWGLICLILVGNLIIMRNPWNRSPYTRTDETIQKICGFALSLEKEALLAGPPKVMDYIPLFAKKKIYLGYETSHPLYDNYYREISRRFKRLADIYFSGSRAELLEGAHQEKIDYLVIDRSHFDQDPLHVPESFTPHQKDFSDVKASRGKELFLRHPPKDWIRFQSDNYLVLKIPLK